MFISKKQDYKKLYLPGYSGHVPRKNDLFGITAGDANHILTQKEGADKFFNSGGVRPVNWDLKQTQAIAVSPDLKADSLKYTNWSKNASNWICGPVHEIRLQHIPGYNGHVQGIRSENVHGRTYARSTATAINRKSMSLVNGQHISSKETFTSMNKKEFSPDNFRRYIENPEAHGAKDYSDYAKNLNEEYYDNKVKVIQRSDPVTANTICSKTSSNFFSTRKTARSNKFGQSQSDFNPEESEVKPKLLETKLVHKEDFF